MADEVKRRKPRRRFLRGEPLAQEGPNWVSAQDGNWGIQLMSEREARKMLREHPDERIYELVPVVP